MNSQFVFEADLGVFKYHFPGHAVVPGVLLLDHVIAACGSDPEPSRVTLSQVRFHQFVRPGETVHFDTSSDQSVRISGSQTLHCTFRVDRSDRLTECPCSAVEERSLLAVKPLRDAAYWFLPDSIEVTRDAGTSRIDIDLDELASRHPYLTEIPRWPLLALTESAGNLALALQHLARPDASSDGYVFARFDAFSYRTDSLSWRGQRTVITTIRRWGSPLVWDACVHGAGGTNIVIQGAVSHRGRGR